MSARGACLACRARKVCERGPAQRCKRCTMMDLDGCVYEKTKKRGTGATLRGGEACKRCRARKRKCDAKRPCTTCVETNSAPECEYEIVSTQPRPSSHHQFLFWNKPNSSSSSDTFARERWTVEEAVPQISTKAPVATITQSNPEAVPPARALIHSLSHLPPYKPPEPQPHTLNGVRTHDPTRITLPPFSLLSTLIFPGIPPEPHVALSSLGPERFQLSDTALEELDMKFRLRVVCRLIKLAVRFTSEKQQALLRGDTSGTIIHPFFISAAHSLGMHFCEGMANVPAMVRLQAKYVQESLELLTEIHKGSDWELRAQVAIWITAGSVIMRLGYLTSLYVKRSCEAVDMARLQFVPTYGRPPAFSEDLHERLSLLTQAIYFENFLFLTCGGPEPSMTTRIEKEFRHKLQVRPAISSSFTFRIQHFPIGGLPGIVQDLPVDHAHAKYSAGQRHGGCTRPSSYRR
ncbi:hypothetical protein BDM02DRAFT_491555 [Thelephora ganbajun]|uniref:Uncharacterized protein n=1 Tax=Thelephora ganbajun TaxID=370292 RepID=A0ACB6Z7G1_THEGA|nr:hypothetical protein BDM02DRAFT_491555 [Thelephora ganbajun]